MTILTITRSYANVASSPSADLDQEVLFLERALNGAMRALHSANSFRSESIAQAKEKFKSAASSFAKLSLKPEFAPIKSKMGRVLEQIQGRLAARDKETERVDAVRLHSISEGGMLKQIPVLAQEEDLTGFGEQNCGYHALKNGLVALLSKKENVNVAALFKDQQFFQLFYETYCAPLLAHRKADQRKASVPLLREILENFKKDKNPPAGLRELHHVLSAKEEIPLAIFNITDESEFFFTGEEDQHDVQKLIAFHKNPGPADLICLCGSSLTGHWYTILLHKELSGQVSYVILDSDKSTSNDSEIFSPASQIAKALIENMQNPNELLWKSHLPLLEEFANKAKKISDDGKVSKENRKTLLSNNKEEMQKRISSLIHCISLMQKQGWLRSTDSEKQSYAASLEKLLKFYAANLSPRDPNFAAISRAVIAINQEKTKKPLIEEVIKKIDHKIDRIRNFCHSIYSPSDEHYKRIMQLCDDFEQSKNQLSTESYDVFSMVLWQLFSLKKNLKDTAAKKKDGDLNKILSLYGGTEGTFEVASTDEAARELDVRISLLLETYLHSKGKKDLLSLFSCFQKGGACLNARTMNLVNYISSLDGLPTSNDYLTDDYYTLAADAIADVMLNTFDNPDTGLTVDNSTPEKFAQYLLENSLVKMEEHFEKYQNAKLGQAFLELLELEGIYKKGDPIHWNILLSAFIKGKSFAKAYDKAFAQAKDFF